MQAAAWQAAAAAVPVAYVTEAWLAAAAAVPVAYVTEAWQAAAAAVPVAYVTEAWLAGLSQVQQVGMHMHRMLADAREERSMLKVRNEAGSHCRHNVSKGKEELCIGVRGLLRAGSWLIQAVAG